MCYNDGVVSCKVVSNFMLKIKKKNNKQIVIYKGKGGPKLEVSFKDDTVWLTQKQIAELFNIERSVITKHIGNIFRTKELKEGLVSAKFAHTATDSKIYKTKYYNLDMIISIGYRANSIRVTQFRIWATKTLKTYLVEGVAVNENRLKQIKQNQSINLINDR